MADKILTVEGLRDLTSKHYRLRSIYISIETLGDARAINDETGKPENPNLTITVSGFKDHRINSVSIDRAAVDAALVAAISALQNEKKLLQDELTAAGVDWSDIEEDIGHDR